MKKQNKIIVSVIVGASLVLGTLGVLNPELLMGSFFRIKTAASVEAKCQDLQTRYADPDISAVKQGGLIEQYEQRDCISVLDEPIGEAPVQEPDPDPLEKPATKAVAKEVILLQRTAARIQECESIQNAYRALDDEGIKTQGRDIQKTYITKQCNDVIGSTYNRGEWLTRKDVPAGPITKQNSIYVPKLGKGTTYYINAQDGDDTNSGKFTNQAWKTCGKLNTFSKTPGFQPGDNILFAAGQRFINCQVTFASSGTAAKKIHVSSYGEGARPMLYGPQRSGNVWMAVQGSSHVQLDNLAITNGTYGVYLGLAKTKPPYGQNSGRGYEIIHSEIYQNRASGIRVFGAEKLTIKNNSIYRNNRLGGNVHAGVYIDSPEGERLENIRIEGNEIFENDPPKDDLSNFGDGIRLSNGNNEPFYENLQILNNKIYDNGRENQAKFGRGVTGSFCGNVKIMGNEIFNNAATGITLGSTARGCRDEYTVEVIRNIFYNHPTRNMSCSAKYPGNICKYYHNTFIQQPGLARSAYNIQVSSKSCQKMEECKGTVDVRNNIFYSDTGKEKCNTLRGRRAEFMSDRGLAPEKVVKNFIANNNMYFSSDDPLCRDFSDETEQCDFSCWQRKGYGLASKYMLNPLFNQYNPLDDLFTNHDFNLSTNSPAIDAGVLIQGVNDDFKGSAPDMGAFEFDG